MFGRTVFDRNGKVHIGGVLVSDNRIGKLHIEVDSDVAVERDRMTRKANAYPRGRRESSIIESAVVADIACFKYICAVGKRLLKRDRTAVAVGGYAYVISVCQSYR